MRSFDSFSKEVLSEISNTEKKAEILKKQLKRLEDCKECYLTNEVYLIGRYPDLEKAKVLEVIMESNLIKIKYNIMSTTYHTNLDFVCLNEAELIEFKIKKTNQELENLTSNIKGAERVLVEQKETIERLYVKKESLLEQLRELESNGR